MADKQALDTVLGTLPELPTNMRFFSLSLRSLYAKYALGSTSETTKQINKIRDDTRTDAVLYVKGILPFSIRVVRSIQSYFEYYSALTLEEWKENLKDILDEVKGYKQCCEEIVRMHEAIIIPLKKREDEATKLLSQLHNLTEEYERREREYQKNASNKRKWAMGLSFIPGVSVIAGPLLGMSADSDMADAVAVAEQSKINEATIRVVSNVLIPALKAFIHGLDSVAGFFCVIETELQNFEDRGAKALEDAKKLHYIMMKKKALEVAGYCRTFYAMIPGVRTDLAAIPENPDDQNYVDKWLAEKKEEIKKKYTNRMSKGLKNMLECFTTEAASQSMENREDSST